MDQYKFDESKYINFINQIMGNYDFYPDFRNEINSIIQKVLAKRAQQTLALAVVGEFSSGKSTLINTLIRDDLLKTDVLQGTTTAATFIRYGDPIDVSVNMGNQWLSYRADGLGIWSKFKRFFKKPTFDNEKEEIRNFIHKVSADESISIQLQDVIIKHPSEVLQHIEVIDTPGANADNQRHGEVAAHILDTIADIAIIAIPADMAGSDSLLKFVKKNLRDVIHRCVFVVTKMDMLTSDRERFRLQKQLKQRLSRSLGNQNISVVYTAPKLTLDLIQEREIESNLNPESARLLAESFFDIEKEIYRFMLSQRQLVISEKVSKMIYMSFESLSQKIKDMEINYKERQNHIQMNMIPNLPQYVAQERSRFNDHLGRQFENIHFDQDLSNEESQTLYRLSSLISNISSKEELSKFASSQAQGFMSRIQHDISRVMNSVQNVFINTTEASAHQFKTEFNQVFKRLANLQKRDIHIQSSINGSYQATNNSLANIDHIVSTYSSAADDEAVMGFGGGAVGAALGTFLIPIPGIGTLVGGAIGAFFGSLFGPSLDDLKQELRSKLTDEVKKMFDIARSKSHQVKSQIVNNELTRIDQLIVAHFSAYENLAASIFEQENRELDEINKIKININRDLQMLNASKSQLANEIQLMRGITQAI